jgi:hypothetical protein
VLGKILYADHLAVLHRGHARPFLGERDTAGLSVFDPSPRTSKLQVTVVREV